MADASPPTCSTPSRGAPARACTSSCSAPTARLQAKASPTATAASASSPGPSRGIYRIVFHPPSPFFKRVELEVELGEGHFHVPLLISSYGCASYRGS